MGDRIGQTFDGVVSFISRGGISIEDKKSKSEGMVKMSAIGDDYYEYDETNNCIRGERNREVFKIGDEVRFTVVSINMDERTIAYKLER
ncbi:MAG: S1 RNA-binding domain-containing protein [Cyanobium sp. MAG06]|nr:S1 RNA-binding domain-containing protein [Cyanobium sp. MAG06]